MMRTPDGQGIEPDKFHTPDAVRFGFVAAPVNALCLRRIVFAVGDTDVAVARRQPMASNSLAEWSAGLVLARLHLWA